MIVIPIYFLKIVKSFFQGRDSHLTRASVGPDEPHAASPALSDPLLEKPGLNYMDQDQELEKAELERLLNYSLPSHPKLLRGELKNGLRYFILPNKNPADRYHLYGLHFIEIVYL